MIDVLRLAVAHRASPALRLDPRIDVRGRDAIPGSKVVIARAAVETLLCSCGPGVMARLAVAPTTFPAAPVPGEIVERLDRLAVRAIPLARRELTPVVNVTALCHWLALTIEAEPNLKTRLLLEIVTVLPP